MSDADWVGAGFLAAVIGGIFWLVVSMASCDRAAYLECAKACGGVDKVARSTPTNCRCRGVAVYP